MAARAAGSLLAHLAGLSDPRARQGRRHSLAAMLAAIVCAVLTGARGYKAIAAWLHDQEVPVWHWLGFWRTPPTTNCFRDLLLALPPEALEERLRAWIEAVLGKPLADEIVPLAMDGKTLCGTLDEHGRSVHLLALFDQECGGVFRQLAVPGKTNEAKAALDILRTLVLEGRLITGDAMFCQKEICQQVVDAGGDYLFVVKDNQRELKEAIDAELAPGFSPL